MKNKDLIDILRSEIQTAANRGIEMWPLGAYDKYLAGLEELADDEGTLDTLLTEKYRAKVQGELAAYQHEVTQNVELLRSVVGGGDQIAKALMLLNGGAILALLAFMGHLTTIDDGWVKVTLFVEPIRWFVGALVAVMLTFGTIYFVNLAFYLGKRQLGVWLRGLTALLMIAALGFFVYGCYSTARIFESKEATGQVNSRRPKVFADYVRFDLKSRTTGAPDPELIDNFFAAGRAPGAFSPREADQPLDLEQSLQKVIPNQYSSGSYI